MERKEFVEQAAHIMRKAYWLCETASKEGFLALEDYLDDWEK